MPDATGASLAFAGLWESWRDPAGEVLRTFAILTTTANADMAGLHHNMSVIREPEAWRVWLGEAVGDHEALLRPAGLGLVMLWPVSRAVNNVRNNGSALPDEVTDAGAEMATEAALDSNPA